jgi:acetyl/propionyl-CoA carboxylase alpha subunit
LPDHRLRIDTGVEEGGEVSQFYDPMIAKLIVHRSSRTAAAEALASACSELEVWPVRTNAGFLVRCLQHPRFVAGDVDTGFIGAEEEALVAAKPSATLLAEVANHALDRDPPSTERSSAWSSLAGAMGFRLNAAAHSTVRLWAHDGVHDVHPALSGKYRRTTVLMGPSIVGFEHGDAFGFMDRPPLLKNGAASPASDGSLRAPMPGKIVATPAKPGDIVTKGQPLIVLEAMKMEHALVAPFDGVVETIGAAVGEQVVDGAVLATVNPEGKE